MQDDLLLRRSATPRLQPDGASRVGSRVVVGSFAAMVVVFALVTVGVGAVTDSFAVGALMGLFCAGWGGIGFGMMFSGALAVLREGDR